MVVIEQAKINQDDDTVHHVDVILRPRAEGGYEALAPCQGHKLDRVYSGDVVQWHLRTVGRDAIDVVIGRFTVPKHFVGKPDPVHRHDSPFGNAKQLPAVRVTPEGETVSYRVRNDWSGPLTSARAITYKYSIDVNGVEVLDPEVEIER